MKSIFDNKFAKSEKSIKYGRYGNWAALAVTAGLFAIAWLTLHDMQMAEGTGLYLAIKAGRESRRLYDLAVDAAGMLGLFAAIFLPCLLAKRLQATSFLRLFTAYIAFLPVMSTASLVHLLDGTTQITLRESLRAGNLGIAVMEGFGGIAPVLGTAVPVLVLLFAVYQGSVVPGNCEKTTEKNVKTKRKNKSLLSSWWWCVPAIQICLLAAALLFPALTEQCHYWVQYSLLLYGFVLWEKVLEKCPGLRTWGWILFAVFSLRGIDRMIEVMSVYHI